jgi:hypothetical protein
MHKLTIGFKFTTPSFSGFSIARNSELVLVLGSLVLDLRVWKSNQISSTSFSAKYD